MRKLLLLIASMLFATSAAYPCYVCSGSTCVNGIPNGWEICVTGQPGQPCALYYQCLAPGGTACTIPIGELKEMEASLRTMDHPKVTVLRAAYKDEVKRILDSVKGARVTVVDQ